MTQLTNDVDEKEVDLLKKRLNNVDNPTVIIELPQVFEKLHPVQQKDAINRLQKLPLELQQALLNDWDTRIQVGTVERKAGYLFKLLAQAAQGKYVPPAVPEKEIQTPDVLYQYKTKASEEQKNEDKPPVLPAQEAAKIARALRDREKQFQAQRNLTPTADQQKNQEGEKMEEKRQEQKIHNDMNIKKEV